MADDPRTRTRNFLGLDPLKGQKGATQRSAYARLTAPGDDTTTQQLYVGIALYVVLTVMSVALFLGSAGFGKVLFAVFGVFGFLFISQRIIMLGQRRTPDPD